MRARRLLLLSGLLAGSAALASPMAASAPLPAEHNRSGLLQEVAGDTLPRDTLPADSAAAPAAAASADTAPPLRSMPGPPPADSAFALRRFSCGRGCLLEHNTLVLMDLLEKEMPGLTMLRGSYFGGPHQLASGTLGPGFVRVLLDGRPVPSLAGGGFDLARIPVGRLDRVTVTETPGGITIEATPVRRREPRAYSRISAATGQPDVEAIHALFTNGLGRSLEISTGIDLLNTGGAGAGGDRFDFWGNVAWLPGEDGAGVELQWRNQSLDRIGLDTVALDRREIHVVGRGRVAEEAWITVTAGNSRRGVSAGGGAGVGGVGDSPDSLTVEVDAASAALRLGGGSRSLTTRLEARDGPGHPSLRARLAGVLEPVDRLSLSGALAGSRWDAFDGWRLEGGAVFRPGAGVDLALGAGGAVGVEGVPRPLEGTADSVTFRQVHGRASARWGPVSGTIRGIYQDVSRQLPFGGTFDPGLEPGPGVEVGGVEATVDLPVAPLDWLLGKGVEPIRLAGTWRHQEVVGGGGAAAGGAGEATAPGALYLPADQARVGAYFRDSFFRGDLRVDAELAVRHRSSMVTVDPSPAGATGRVAGWTTLDWNLTLTLKDVRIWWRVDNTRGAPWEDVVGVTRPARRNVFGVKWEFFN